MNSFSLQTRLYSGRGSLDVLKRFTNKYTWITYDAFLVRSPLIEKLRNALPADNRISTFSSITPDPTIGTVVQGIAQVRPLRSDVAMGFDDGSALDAVGTIVWLSRQFGIDIETCVVISTTNGTGSEVASTCVINDPDKGIKYSLLNNALYPDMAIPDPTLVVSVPPAIIANTDMSMLTHALEAYTPTKVSDFTDVLTEKAVQTVLQYLPVAASKGDCLAARGRMHNASALVGMAFSQTRLGINHAIVHQLGGQFHLSHGLANALLLTHVIHFNARNPWAAKYHARFARAYHSYPDNTNDTATLSVLTHYIELLKKQCALPPLVDTLKDGKRAWSQRIPSMVQAVLVDITLQTNPRVAGASTMQKLLEELL